MSRKLIVGTAATAVAVIYIAFNGADQGPGLYNPDVHGYATVTSGAAYLVGILAMILIGGLTVAYYLRTNPGPDYSRTGMLLLGSCIAIAVLGGLYALWTMYVSTGESHSLTNWVIGGALFFIVCGGLIGRLNRA